jgi:hypothetical protein
MKREFVTCLNCIDGRVQLPAIHWIKANYEVKYIDMINTPGMDGILADRNSNRRYPRKGKCITRGTFNRLYIHSGS